MSERSSYRLIGDPHITRKFEVGVPLARKGEREANLFEDFKSRLYAGTEKNIVVVGDLFEKPICSLLDLHSTMKILLTAAARQPHRNILVMCGNHDISPQKNNPGAFDILMMLNGYFDNLKFITKPTVFDHIAMFPWEWDRTAEEQLEDLEPGSFTVAVGHWDLVAYDEFHTEHLCPAAKLVEMGAEKLYSGHWHVAGDYVIEGHTVHCTGSMQPMTHAEDPEGKMYVTLTLDEYQATDPATLKNKYVRVTVEGDETVDGPEDCLGFKLQRSKASEEISEVKIEDFSVAAVIKKSFDKHEVPNEVQTYIKDRINADD